MRAIEQTSIYSLQLGSHRMGWEELFVWLSRMVINLCSPEFLRRASRVMTSDDKSGATSGGVIHRRWSLAALTFCWHCSEHFWRGAQTLHGNCVRQKTRTM